MNITFDILRLVPKFLLRDRNGYALAKAIEKAFALCADAAQAGLDAMLDPAQMPEWRLDELAGEYNIPYDYSADIEAKRKWIGDAYNMSRILGTPAGISQFLAGRFDEATISEAAEYGGDPFHFKLDLTGAWSDSIQAWVLRAIGHAKNKRSVLDGVNVHLPKIESNIPLHWGLALYGAATQTFGATDQPDLDEQGFLQDEAGDYLTDEKFVALGD